jgi:hypothetical protein
VILKGIEKGDITDSLAKACKDGSDDKSNPDVVALEQTKLSEKQLLTFVINLQKLLNYVSIVFSPLFMQVEEKIRQEAVKISVVK